MAGPLDPTYGVAFVTLFLATMQTLRDGVNPGLSFLSLVSQGLLDAEDHGLWTAPASRYVNLNVRPVAKVVCVVILETLQIVFYFYGMYWNLIDNFAVFAALDVIIWQDSAQLLFGYLSAFIVQMYFGYCIYMLNPKGKIVPATIVLLGLASPGSAIDVRTRQLGFFSHLSSSEPIITTQSASTLACDIVITSALVFTLRGKKGEIASTNSLLSTLIINAVNRGVLTAICATINMILFIVRPNTFYFFLGLIPSGKLYMNSMLATLNTREHLRNKAGIVQSMSLANLSSVGGINSVHQPDNSRSNMGMGIALTEETFTDRNQTDGNLKGGYIAY
ncbi:hypothetical protein C8J57DRAFT_1714328 [Mycena rebaudengoi]|nr:hypothetical protein C8J57DRAFT_1714328 [Mycena rebaudengoi]